MAKKRKTRQDKIIADLRHQISVSAPQSIQERKTITETKVVLSPSFERNYSSQTINPTVLIGDLRKTLTLTSAFIGFQVLLYFLLKTHIVSIPGLNY